MNANQRGQLAKQLLPLLRRGWPLWGVSHSRRTGVLTLAPSPDPHPHPERLCIDVHCPTRRWQIMQGAEIVASGPDPGDPHQVYRGRDWHRVMGENIREAWRGLVAPPRNKPDPDSTEAIAARYAEQGRLNLAVHERAREPLDVLRTFRCTASEAALIEEARNGRHRGETIRELVLLGLASKRRGAT